MISSPVVERGGFGGVGRTIPTFGTESAPPILEGAADGGQTILILEPFEVGDCNEAPPNVMVSPE